MQMNPDSAKQRQLFRDKSFFSEEKYIFSRVVRDAYPSDNFIENKILDLIFAMKITIDN